MEHCFRLAEILRVVLIVRWDLTIFTTICLFLSRIKRWNSSSHERLYIKEFMHCLALFLCKAVLVRRILNLAIPDIHIARSYCTRVVGVAESRPGHGL